MLVYTYMYQVRTAYFFLVIFSYVIIISFSCKNLNFISLSWKKLDMYNSWIFLILKNIHFPSNRPLKTMLRNDKTMQSGHNAKYLLNILNIYLSLCSAFINIKGNFQHSEISVKELLSKCFSRL